MWRRRCRPPPPARWADCSGLAPATGTYAMNRQPPPPPHCDSRAPSPTPCGARFAWPLLAGCSLLLAGNVCAQEGAHDERLRQLEARLAEQDRQIGALQQLVERQQHALDGLTREVGVSRLDDLRARGGTPALAQLPLAAGQAGVAASPQADADDAASIARTDTTAPEGPQVAIGRAACRETGSTRRNAGWA